MPMKMTHTQDMRTVRRMEADREELAERMARAMPRDGVAEPQPGVHSQPLRPTARPRPRIP